MAKWKITLTGPTQPQSGNRIIIDSPAGTELFFFEFYNVGDSLPTKNPVLIGVSNVETIYNLYTSFQANYNQLGIYIVNKGADVIDITGTFPAEPVLGNILPIGWSFGVVIVEDNLAIISDTFSENVTDNCAYVDVIITANKFFNELITPYPDTFVNTESYRVLNVNRGSFVTISIKDENGNTAKVVVTTPSYLNEGLINVQVANNTVVVSDNTSGLILQYSLNGVDWQDSNTFNGLTNGDYTLYVRDQFNCQTTSIFTIKVGEDGTTIISDPYFFYSKANSVRMADRVQWDECITFKNSNNTLSCEVIDDVKRTEKQYWRSCTPITLQFKNNYDDLKIITSDDGLIQPLVQKSNNTNLKKSMDCSVVDLGDGKMGIYFIAGDTYNYDTGFNLNEPYVLNGELPQFGNIGNIITISAINYTIEDITYNEDLQVNQLIISSTALIGVTNTIVKAIYNIFNYELFEVVIALSGRTKFNIEVWYDGEIQKSSELIVIDDYSTDLVYVQWYMDHNTDLFYSTGIIPSTWLKIDMIKAGIKNEGESYETDSSSYLIESDNYEIDIFKFLPLTKEMSKCVVLWLSSHNVEIRGIDYRKDSIENEALERSNLYVLTATMLLKGTGLFEDRTGTSNVEIVELIQTESDEYIKIN